VHIRRTIEELAREPIAAVGVDGCGAPLFALTLGGLARAFRTLVLAEPGSPERKVADAMRKFPEWTSGTTRDENKLMASVPGLLLKSGAEGVDAFALPDGTAAAVKIDDGNARVRTPVTAAILALLGAQPPADLATSVVLGGGSPVGVIRATRLVLFPALATARSVFLGLRRRNDVASCCNVTAVSRGYNTEHGTSDS
jgi:L-asparaginase II